MTATITGNPRTTTIPLIVWGHHDVDVPVPAVSPDLIIGDHIPPAGVAIAQRVDEWVRRGVRRVQLPEVVDLTSKYDGRDVVTMLMTVAELTSRGMSVDWELDLTANMSTWVGITHLAPPRVLHGDADGTILAQWRDAFYVDQCLYRHGPGFVQVRDRRDGTLRCIVIDDPAYLHACTALIQGCQTHEVPADILDDYLEEMLVAVVGAWAWWLPYRVRRWPDPSFAV
ncbi:hypothetical protein KEM60_03112 [Austwickia sp. TVS 96-490-7B]|uniref:DUF5825 family protein n=1 Tax=Austwickia sp. TVS 96-490-7B TaxID=2830843 RepID=UPI001C58CD19|nr:DUF5825 family protein [Austwickia sp. TVS 96-490-7B]MBW3086883.1 hypothetical protein [Austwickia sp. TVS 96-490-7B]